MFKIVAMSWCRRFVAGGVAAVTADVVDVVVAIVVVVVAAVERVGRQTMQNAPVDATVDAAVAFSGRGGDALATLIVTV